MIELHRACSVSRPALLAAAPFREPDDYVLRRSGLEVCRRRLLPWPISLCFAKGIVSFGSFTGLRSRQLIVDTRTLESSSERGLFIKRAIVSQAALLLRFLQGALAWSLLATLLAGQCVPSANKPVTIFEAPCSHRLRRTSIGALCVSLTPRHPSAQAWC